jgi:uncharacterized membrane protein
VLSSVFLGAASGLRSQLGLAAVVARSDPSLPTLLRHAWTKRVLMAGAAVELVVDKLPATPSRLAPVGITSRLVLGGLAAGLSARTRQAPWPPAAAIGASSAILAAKVGHDVRAQFARPVPDSAVAIVEDGLAFALASAGASRWLVSGLQRSRPPRRRADAREQLRTAHEMLDAGGVDGFAERGRASDEHASANRAATGDHAGATCKQLVEERDRLRERLQRM